MSDLNCYDVHRTPLPYVTLTDATVAGADFRKGTYVGDPSVAKILLDLVTVFLVIMTMIMV